MNFLTIEDIHTYTRYDYSDFVGIWPKTDYLKLKAFYGVNR